MSTHFIISAILVKESDLERMYREVEEIRKKHFGNGEMKSSNMGSKKHDRRQRILGELSKLPFTIFAMVFDKKKMQTFPGLQYKKSFYKFLNKQVHRELTKTFTTLTITADEVGGSDYIKSMAKYFQQNLEIPSLFGEANIIFENSQNNVLVQLADIISGTLSYVYDDHKHKDDTPNYYRILEKKITRVQLFPISYDSYKVNTAMVNGEYDETIAELCYKKAVDFLKKYEEPDTEEEQAQVIVLKYLLFRFMYDRTQSYISTKELKQQLKHTQFFDISTQTFRTRIIGRLRDQGVIISGSSAKKGYKIPTKEEELYDFINHGTSIIMPMLSRLKKCRDAVKLGTTNQVDLFEKTQYAELKRFFDD